MASQPQLSSVTSNPMVRATIPDNISSVYNLIDKSWISASHGIPAQSSLSDDSAGPLQPHGCYLRCLDRRRYQR